MILNIRIDHKTADIGKIEESTMKMDEIFTKIKKIMRYKNMFR